MALGLVQSGCQKFGHPSHIPIEAILVTRDRANLKTESIPEFGRIACQYICHHESHGPDGLTIVKDIDVLTSLDLRDGGAQIIDFNSDLAERQLIEQKYGQLTAEQIEAGVRKLSNAANN